MRSRFTICAALLMALIAFCIRNDQAAAQKWISAPSSSPQSHTSPPRVKSIRFEFRVGLCDCYCGSVMEVSPGRATLFKQVFRECHERNPAKYRNYRVDADLSGNHWRKLRQLVDHDALFALP